MEYGTDRLTPAPRLDRHRLRQVENRLSLLQHPRLEHLPHPYAHHILLAHEHYFPATIADMYDPDRMDSEFPLVREAHDRNDEVLERIYIGRRFKNDTERLEKLFEMYTKMTAQQTPPKKSAKRK